METTENELSKCYTIIAKHKEPVTISFLLKRSVLGPG
jgi:hypothetical protein